MSKIKTVLSREGKEIELTAVQCRKMRKAERQSRVNMPNFRCHLPYDAPSINRLFFYLRPISSGELEKEFVGVYTAEDEGNEEARTGIKAETVASENAVTLVAAPVAPKKTRKSPSKASAASKSASKTPRIRKPAPVATVATAVLV